jgi:hypothetical protein
VAECFQADFGANQKHHREPPTAWGERSHLWPYTTREDVSDNTERDASYQENKPLHEAPVRFGYRQSESKHKFARENARINYIYLVGMALYTIFLCFFIPDKCDCAELSDGITYWPAGEN